MASIRKPNKKGGTFGIRWRTRDGRDCERGGFATEKEARQYGQEQEALERKNKNTKPSDLKMTVREFVVDVYAKTLDVRRQTRDDYNLSLKNWVYPTFGDVALVDIKPADLKAWIIEMKQTVSESYAQKHANLLGAILKCAVDNNYLDKSPFGPVKRKKAKRVTKVTPFSKTLVKQIADQFAERFRLLIWICYYTGMRPSEALGLTMDQLDFENGQIVIDRQLSRFTNTVHEKYLKTTKSHRTIGFSKKLQVLIQEHVAKFGLGPSNLILSNRSGNVWRYHDAAEMFREKVRPLGIAKGMGLHQLRHTCVSVLIARGSNIKEVQEWVGHESIQETMDTYGHLFPTAMAKLSDHLDAYDDEEDDNLLIASAN
jgi:integrase